MGKTDDEKREGAENGKIYGKRLKANIMYALPYWVASVITGLAAVVYAKMFTWCEDISGVLFQSNQWLVFVITPLCFVLAWWVVRKFEQRAAGSGIPQVMAAVEMAAPKYDKIVDKLLSLRNIAVKVMSSLLMVLGGGAIGREGPTVHIAGSIFRTVGKIFPQSRMRVSKSNMILTGAAAGLAAAFNTPLGGIVFAIEELSKTHFNHFKKAIFTAVIIAGLTAQAIMGPYLYIGYPDVSELLNYIMLYVVIVALVCGILGSYMSVVILKLMAWRRKLKGKKIEILYVLGAALLIACIAYFGNASVMGSGKKEMVGILFEDNKHIDLSLPLYRIIGPIISFTSGAAGGIFAPSLSAGATVGTVLAEVFGITGSNANLMILAGMVAFLTGVTRSPFTSAILVLEMTNSHNIIFSLMLAGIVSSLISMLIDKQSLYDHIKLSYLKEADAELITEKSETINR